MALGHLVDLTEVARGDLAQFPDTSSVRGNVVEIVADTVERLLGSPGDAVQTYLRAIADGYTLFAFMRETPNVQSAVSKLFSNGEFWFDTSAILPILAERLIDGYRPFTNIISAARKAGARCYLTAGVLDELNAHIENSLSAWRNPNAWSSKTPFLLNAYIWSGRSGRDFAKWIEHMRGLARPLDDLTEFLRDELGLLLFGLDDLVKAAPEDLRWQTQEWWSEVHERRRKNQGAPVIPESIRQLAVHDTENFLGVLQRRAGEQVGNPFGYSAWWLTMDSFADRAASAIAKRVGLDRLDSPVMSFEFLTQYLIVGPARGQLNKAKEAQLPLALNTSLLDGLPTALLHAAEAARETVRDTDERVVRRKIRDHMDGQKLRVGRDRRTTLEAVEADIRLILGKQRQ